eukprot:SAG11_NODE_1650_length_4510_cov_6.795738_3_plen_44_part_00
MSVHGETPRIEAQRSAANSLPSSSTPWACSRNTVSFFKPARES